jgi:tol-pal system protein YbgF
MKLAFVLMVCACSAVFAESRVLPPVIDSSIYSSGGSSSSGGSTAPSVNAMYEVMGRLEQMQLELQQLRGVVEDQSKTISDLKQRQNNIYSDLDLRIQELTRTVTGNKTVAVIENRQTQTGVAAPEIVSPNEQTAASPAPESAEQDSTVLTGDGGSSGGNEKEVYQAAYETLRNGHNERAITAFKGLLNEFPEGEYADNAQYWLGEAYKVNQNLDSAKQAFTKVVTYHPGSPKVPDALLKLGYIELEQNNMAKARDYLTQITVNHPGTTAAHLAEKKLMQIGYLQ